MSLSDRQKDDKLTSVEELLAYIEGGEGDDNEQIKSSKRQKKRQKKVRIKFVLILINFLSLDTWISPFGR